jgi:hypothetical protein
MCSIRKKKRGGVIGLGEEKRKKKVGGRVNHQAFGFYLSSSSCILFLSAAPARSSIYVVSFI